jgi:hypothetical protein
MKRLLILAPLLVSRAALAQGPLTPPPGAPAASMKTLDQIEPRKPLAAGQAGVVAGPSGTITVSQPGSYFLTDNLVITSGDGIIITANDVTLDLRGFTISTAANTSNSSGINLQSSTRIHIRDGGIRGGVIYSAGNFSGSGFFTGIHSASTTALVRVSNISVEGMQLFGINLGGNPGTVVESCMVRSIGNTGIWAGAVTDSVALVVGTAPIIATTAANCIGKKADGTDSLLATQPTLSSVKADTAIAAAAADKRTAIPAATSTYTISTPGSYVLMGNLTVATGNGINISADDVSLDLNGFTIASTSPTASGDAISFVGPRTRIAISNGHIRSGVGYAAGVFSNGPGFDSGINWPTSAPSAVRVAGISVTGVRSFGIDLGGIDSCIIQACSVRVAGAIGIRAGVVSDSSVTLGGTTTISASRIANSVGSRADGTGSGIPASNNTLDGIASTASATQTSIAAVQSTATATQTSIATVQTSVDTANAARDRRTPISTAGLTLTSGSYYLTQSLIVSSGNIIQIASGSEVTLDLNGFTLASTAITGVDYAIQIPNNSSGRIAIMNGFIRGSGTPNAIQGINANGAIGSVTVSNVQFKDVLNGVNLTGGGGVVENCSVSGARLGGIQAQVVRGCVVTGAQTSGIIGETVTGCSVTCTSDSNFAAINAATISHCRARHNGAGTALDADSVTDSSGSSEGGRGIDAQTVSNSTGTSTSGTGIKGNVITASYGTSSTGNGVECTDTATNTTGYTFNGSSGGTGLTAFTATSSRGKKGDPAVVSQSITNKYNMP